MKVQGKGQAKEVIFDGIIICDVRRFDNKFLIRPNCKNIV